MRGKLLPLGSGLGLGQIRVYAQIMGSVDVDPEPGGRQHYYRKPIKRCRLPSHPYVYNFSYDGSSLISRTVKSTQKITDGCRGKILHRLHHRHAYHHRHPWTARTYAFHRRMT
jgi:hypothetical protein